MGKEVYKEANASPAWYLQIYSLLMSIGFEIKYVLEMVPDMLYPDNPAADSFFPSLSTERLLGYLSYLSPISVIFNIGSTGKAIKNFYYQENKNFEKCLDLAVKILTTGASVAFLGILLAGSAALVLSVAPYLLLAATGLGAIYGLFNIGKHLYRAFKADDKEKRNAHLVQACKQVAATIVNGLACVVTFFLGVQVNAEFSQLNGGIFHDLDIVKNVGGIFKAAVPYVYALTAAVAVGTMPSLWNTNKETFTSIKNFVTEPVKTLKNASKALSARYGKMWGLVKKSYYIAAPLILIPIVIDIVRVAVNVSIRTAALCFAPVQLLIKGVTSGAKKGITYFKSPAPTDVPASAAGSVKTVLTKLEANPTIAPQVQAEVKAATIITPMTSASDSDAAAKEKARLEFKQLMQAKIAKLEQYGEKISKKDLAKLTLVKTIQQYFDNEDITEEKLNGFIQDAKKISPRVFQSFWRETGEVEEIVIKLRAYLQKFVTVAKQEEVREPANTSVDHLQAVMA